MSPLCGTFVTIFCHKKIVSSQFFFTILFLQLFSSFSLKYIFCLNKVIFFHSRFMVTKNCLKFFKKISKYQKNFLIFFYQFHKIMCKKIFFLFIASTLILPKPFSLKKNIFYSFPHLSLLKFIYLF